MGMLVLLMTFAFSAQLALVSAQNSSVGVQMGNYFEYDVSLSGSQAQIVGLRAYGVTNVTATVTDVTGSNVTYSLEGQYQNGTDKKNDGVCGRIDRRGGEQGEYSDKLEFSCR